MTVARIEDTTIRFFVQVTNLEKGDLEIMSSGPLMESILASCAYPFLISPVKIGNYHYIDGNFTSGYNAPFLRSQGADVVLGLTAGKRELKQHIDWGLFHRVSEPIRALSQKYEELEQKYEPVDLLMDDLGKGFRRDDIQLADSMIRQGHEAALRRMSEIERLVFS